MGPFLLWRVKNSFERLRVFWEEELVSSEEQAFGEGWCTPCVASCQNSLPAGAASDPRQEVLGWREGGWRQGMQSELLLEAFLAPCRAWCDRTSRVFGLLSEHTKVCW